MNHLLALLNKESIKVAHLESIYAADGADPGFVDDAIRAMRLLDPEDAWRAIWLLKRLACDRGLGQADMIRLIDCAEEMTHWAARLNLCQLLATTGCPATRRATLYPYLSECCSNRRPIIRAWAITVLAEFRTEKPYSGPIAKLLQAARADPAPSMQARLRRLRKSAQNRPRLRSRADISLSDSDDD